MNGEQQRPTLGAIGALFQKRILVIVGNYGSGKTELSLSLAKALRADNQPTALVDLDIVNPYFRSAERQAELEAIGVRVLKPNFALTTVDVPSLPADIFTVFVRQEERVIFDVGGDDTGAAALGFYEPYFLRDDVATLFIVNTCRPLTQDADSICDLAARIEARSKRRIDGFIHNSNLSMESTPELLLRSRPILDEVSRRHGAPVVMTCGLPDFREAMPAEIQKTFFPIQPMMRPEWMD